MKKAMLLFVSAVLSMCLAPKIHSQSVGISSDGATPNANAMLDVSSPAAGNGKGLLIPRITEVQRTTASAALAGGLLDDSGKLRGGAAQGLLIYQTNGTQGFYYNTSITLIPAWVYIGGGTVNSVGTTAPLTGGPIITSGTIGITKATASADGYLGQGDFSTFNTGATAANSATNDNTALTIVKRDASGKFSASSINANLTGNVTGNLIGNADTATNVTGPVGISNGGTGGTDQGTARTNLGLGSMAIQNANGIVVTGGTIDGTIIGSTASASGTFTNATVSNTGAFHVGPTIALWKGQGALTGNIVVGDGGGSLTHTGGDEGLYNTFQGIGAGAVTSSGYNSTAVGYQSLCANTIGVDNTAIGSLSLSKNTTASACTAVGYKSLWSNAVGGDGNTAIGCNSLSSNTDGYSNTSIGQNSLELNTHGSGNTATGWGALVGNKIGGNNTATGCSALADNTGSDNTAVGFESLVMNDGGDNNTVVGSTSLDRNTSGNYNTAVGTYALRNNHTGNSNTAIGGSTDVTGIAAYNQTAVGYAAVCDADSHVRIGNDAVTQIGGAVAWSNLSDARAKENVKDSDLGLDFIRKLRPVKFNFIGQSEVRDGFIAQEVESACSELGITFSAVRRPASEKAQYALSYGEFVVPLVNSVKELKKENDELKSENEALKADIKAIKERLGM